MSRRSKMLASVLAVAAAFGSCNRNAVYDHFVHTSSEGWDKRDTVVFDSLPITEGGIYAEAVGLRTTQAYPFKGLTVVVGQTVRPCGAELNDTLSMRLASDAGEVAGKGISVYQYRFPLRTVNLAEGDTLLVRIWHIMKREELPGIVDVGLKVEKH